jgi:hypothetical protein
MKIYPSTMSKMIIWVTYLRVILWNNHVAFGVHNEKVFEVEHARDLGNPLQLLQPILEFTLQDCANFFNSLFSFLLRQRWEVIIKIWLD